MTFLVVLTTFGTSARLEAAPVHFADSSFQQLWAYTDAPVAAGQVQRSWYWGPAPGLTKNEPYSGSKSGTRLVQYFDKARMEINNPNGDRKSQWYVTTGLLVAEMVSGRRQIGDKEYKTQRAAEIAVGGDGLSADPDAPTYTSFRPVASLRGPGDNRAPNRRGEPVTATLSRAGSLGDDPALGLYPGAKIAAYSDVLGHNIPQAMWDFLNLKGVVQKDGVDVQGQSIADWVFVMGYPISEPYWARIKINGIYQDALFQMYERRALAYVPAMPKGWQVQMANVGQHYYEWIYGGPLPVPRVPLWTPTPGVAGVLPAVDATIAPVSGPAGTPFTVSIDGFRSGEDIVSWFTAPDGSATDARFNLTAGPDGTGKNISISTLGMSSGVWAVTFHGKGSNHESIAYFKITPRTAPTPSGTPGAGTPTRVPVTPPMTPVPPGPGTPSPTVPIVPTHPAGGLVLSVQPGFGPPNGQFTFSARGLAGGENVQVTFTDPTGAHVYPADSNNGQYRAAGDGTLSITLEPDQAFASAPLGTWLFEADGLQSGEQGVVGFTLR